MGDILRSKQYDSVSYYRQNKAPGGGCAIVFDKSKYRAVDPEIMVPENVETVWTVLIPKMNAKNSKVKRIAIGSIYSSPRLRVKTETIDHIIESIHLIRAQYDNDVNFFIGGDFNHLPIADILECYGALKSIISVPTRKSAKLEVLLTDLHTLFHPPTTLPPCRLMPTRRGKTVTMTWCCWPLSTTLITKLTELRKPSKRGQSQNPNLSSLKET